MESPLVPDRERLARWSARVRTYAVAVKYADNPDKVMWTDGGQQVVAAGSRFSRGGKAVVNQSSRTNLSRARRASDPPPDIILSGVTHAVAYKERSESGRPLADNRTNCA